MIVLVTILAAIATLLIYEFWAIFTHRKTVSEIVWDANRAYPPLGFLVGLGSGLLLAHFFWR